MVYSLLATKLSTACLPSLLATANCLHLHALQLFLDGYALLTWFQVETCPNRLVTTALLQRVFFGTSIRKTKRQPLFLTVCLIDRIRRDEWIEGWRDE